MDVAFLKGIIMFSAKYNAQLFMMFILSLFLGSSCTGTAKPEIEKLYYEPPDRIIDDYTGMIRTEAVNWAWTQIGFRFSNYQSVELKPLYLFKEVQEQGLSDHLYHGLIAWFKEAGIQLSDSGPIQLECAIVEAKLKKKFFEKYNPFKQGREDFFLEIEVIIRETSSFATVCKIRHVVLAAEAATLPVRLLDDVTAYLDAYK